MKYLIFVLIFPFLGGLNDYREEINYKPKALVKILKKEKIDDLSNLVEIEISDSLESMKFDGKFFQINNSDSDKYKYIYVGRVNSCRAGGCSIDNTLENSNSEYFDYFMIFDRKVVVKQVSIFNYQATHGQEVTSRSWLRQFVGHKSSEKLIVDKNIDSISGATISVYAITNDVREKNRNFEYVK